MAKDDLTDAELDEVSEAYARYFGHDPAGNWILIVHLDNTSEIFRFDRVGDMWCCRPDRELFYRSHRSPFVPAFQRPGNEHDPAGPLDSEQPSNKEIGNA